jgi:hypothetical protein
MKSEGTFELTAIDGANRLGFLAALGALVVADRCGKRATLAWSGQRPTLCVPGASREALLEWMRDDLESWRDDARRASEWWFVDAFRGAKIRAFPSINEEAAREATEAMQVIRIRAEAFRTGLGARLVNEATSKSAREGRRATDQWMGVACEGWRFDEHPLKSAALNGTASIRNEPRNSSFANNLSKLAKAVGKDPRASADCALFGRWDRADGMPVLAWDAGSCGTSGALRGVTVKDSSKAADEEAEIAQRSPFAHWLAFRGLSLLPVAPHARNSLPPNSRRDRENNSLSERWPLWGEHLPLCVVRSLLRYPWDNIDRLPVGVHAVFESRVRSDSNGAPVFVSIGRPVVR